MGLLTFKQIDWGSTKEFIGGFQYEFMERRDGLKGLQQTYDFELKTVELDAGLMYQAVKEGRVDVIGGYSTDGRIDAFDLYVLEDNLGFFPPYEAVVTINQKSLEAYPFLEEVLNKLASKINNAQMRELNYRVDYEKQDVTAVAKAFLASNGFETSAMKTGAPDILIGGKIFTEHFILAEILKILIENYTSLTVATKTGLGGTKICFEALRKKEIDIYVEYTGTGFQVLLSPDEETVNELLTNPDAVYQYVKAHSLEQFGIQWLKPLGFNNTYALMMRKSMRNN